ncbi:MAG: hypothetical protein H6659_06135 [Ardenticatenaceae bacterium]|nr:hypothetical protein [Ardenticatenaceae bacterium]
MKQFIKLTLILFAAGLLLVACTADANEGANVAAQIADFDLPPGYTADFSVTVSGYSVAAYNPGDGHSHLYLIQSNKEEDGEALAAGLSKLVPGSGDVRMTVVENRPVTVRGQNVTAVISEGLNSENTRYRQIMVAFQGKGGPALLALSTPVSTWDETMVANFLVSLR